MKSENSCLASESSVEKPRRSGKPKLFVKTGSWEVGPGDLKRFWERIEKTNSCWIFKGGVPGKWGHRQIRISINGELRGTHAHRLSWFLHNGAIEPGKIICHKCPGGDNPACVNPDHLYEGTCKSNVADTERSGRGNHPSLEDHGRTMLTMEDVKHIRSVYTPRHKSYGGSALARKYGVSDSCIAHIMSGKNWPGV